MNEQLKALLAHLDRIQNEDRLRESEELTRRALNWEPVERLPVTMSCPLDADSAFTPFPWAEALAEPEKMLFNELTHAFGISIACRDRIADDLAWTVRPNFGTVLIASMFGARVQQVEENPPWVVHDAAHAISLEEVAAQDPRDLDRGWCPRSMDTCAAYREILNAWPDLARQIRMVLPDLQGPFDNLELIVGSDLFGELHSSPERVQRALEAVAACQVAVAERVWAVVNDGPDGFSHQHAVTIKGRILLRNDSVLMMSPRMYRDQIAPHDERVLRALGGGGVHSCGNLGGHTDEFLALDSIRCLDLGQPEMNDLDQIYALARPRKIPMVRMVVPERELLTGRVLDRFPTGVTLLHRAASVADAQRIMDAYRLATEKRSRAGE